MLSIEATRLCWEALVGPVDARRARGERITIVVNRAWLAFDALTIRGRRWRADLKLSPTAGWRHCGTLPISRCRRSETLKLRRSDTGSKILTRAICSGGGCHGGKCRRWALTQRGTDSVGRSCSCCTHVLVGCAVCVRAADSIRSLSWLLQ